MAIIQNRFWFYYFIPSLSSIQSQNFCECLWKFNGYIFVRKKLLTQNTKGIVDSECATFNKWMIWELGRNANRIKWCEEFGMFSNCLLFFWRRFNGSLLNLNSAAFIYCIQDQNQLILFLLEWISRIHEHLHTVNNRNRHKCVKIEHWAFKMLNKFWMLNRFSVQTI